MVDPDGRDYWSTNDPAEIERLLSALKSYGGSKGLLETFNFTKWNHTSDDKITYNDETKTLFGSYVTNQNGSYDVVGFSIKAHSGDESAFSILTEKGRWYERSSGLIKQVNVEFAATVGGTKAGVSLLKWVWNNVINPQGPSTVNTFDAYVGKYFRPGKQASRDANLKQFPKEFQRWFHRYAKETGNFNAPTSELKQLYKEWIRMGKPKIK